jgi:hypothetical protein
VITEQDIADLLAWGEINETSAQALRMRLQMNLRDPAAGSRDQEIRLAEAHERARLSRADVDLPCIAYPGALTACWCRSCRGERGYSEEGRA